MANVFRGFSDHPTIRQRAIKDTSIAIKATSDAVINDPIILFQVVAGGPRLWRNTFMKEFRGNKLVTDDIADLLFQGFCETVVQLHGGDDAVRTASLMLDAIEPVTPPTDKEIADAWKVESASSEDGKREIYGDLHPQEFLDRIKHES